MIDTIIKEAVHGPVETDTELRAAAREAGWALMEVVDEISWEKREQVSDIAARLGRALDAAPSVAVMTLDAKTEAEALADRAGIDIGDDRDMFIDDLAETLTRFSALSAQVQDVAGTVEAFDRDHPELYWHIAKGKITAGEPLYGAIITDIRGNELGDGESNVSAVDAFNIAMDDAALPAAPAKQEPTP